MKSSKKGYTKEIKILTYNLGRAEKSLEKITLEKNRWEDAYKRLAISYSELNQKRSSGLGDTISKLISYIFRGKVKECKGCKKRKAYLNKKFNYKKKRK